MIEKLRARYNGTRVQEVDPDFLEFEEQMIAPQDLELIAQLIESGSSLTLPNPHNSILLYLLEITDDFDFHKARSNTVGGTPPDIDIDFHDRSTAIDWTIKHWGDDNVAKILTHGTYGVKSGTGKYFNAVVPKNKWNSDHTSKLNQQQIDDIYAQQRLVESCIPNDEFGKAADMKKLLEASPELEKNEALDVWRQYMSYVEDKIFTYGVHASGVVVSDFPLWEMMPLMAEHDVETLPDGTTVTHIHRITQFTMGEVEEQGAIKFDFLGIDNLSIIELAISLIKERHGVEINMYAIDDEDKLTYELMAQGMLTGVFQFETSGSAKRLVVESKPSNVEELSDLSALNRPGPLAKQTDDAGNVVGPSIADMYVENKKEGFAPSHQPEAFNNILDGTYWAMIYQEQVMETCSKLAGFTLREADDIRRAIGKKNLKYMSSYKEQFVSNCQSIGGITEQEAQTIWNQMVEFANYSFNKSHSVCYSYLSYVCAWLKANYPEEFFCALMTIRSQHNEKWKKAPEFVFEAKQCNLLVRGPNINRSHANFSLDDSSLYWGFQAVKGIGSATGDSIARARGATKYKDVWDFLDRVDRSRINLGAFKALALAGAFDCMGYDRDALHDSASELYDHIKLEEKAVEKRLKKAEVEAENAKRDARKAELEEDLKAAKTRKKAKKQLTITDSWNLERATRLRRLRELARQCKLTDSPLDSVMTDEEVREYEESVWLRKKPVPKVPTVPPRKSLPRHKQVPITVESLKMQRQYCGAYPAVHPVQVLFPNSKSLANTGPGDYGLFAGEVQAVKEITTRRGQKMAFATFEDQTERAELVIFPNVWRKLKSQRVTDRMDNAIIQVKGKIEQTEPVKIIVDSVKLAKENHEH